MRKVVDINTSRILNIGPNGITVHKNRADVTGYLRIPKERNSCSFETL
jgi:hypothetical protein